jgi:hypothetical protein
VDEYFVVRLSGEADEIAAALNAAAQEKYEWIDRVVLDEATFAIMRRSEAATADLDEGLGPNTSEAN